MAQGRSLWPSIRIDFARTCFACSSAGSACAEAVARSTKAAATTRRNTGCTPGKGPTRYRPAHRSASSDGSDTTRRMLARYKVALVLAIVAAVLIAARIALPYWMKDEVNRRLMLLPNYDGHVEDVDVALWRGAYRVEGVRIVKTGVKSSTPFFDGDRVDFSVEWNSLLHGRIVAECAMWRPNL